ncbi:MAG: Small heat shock protein [Candidatus Peregrinibacteria bacterium GW2011_GWA2_47_7]|nr:MAG: Small heat shock protein [Candidatus Peregrinibacteria bacterium GW2011_GWA2_47_7]
MSQPKKVIPSEREEEFFKKTAKDTSAGNDAESDDTTGDGQLACDVFQTDSEIVVVAPIAGVKKEDLDIDVTDDVLTIRGRRTVSFDVDRSNYFTQECFWGNFSRSIILPESVDVSKIKATFKNAILTIRIPKVEKIRTRKIQIKED